MKNSKLKLYPALVLIGGFGLWLFTYPPEIRYSIDSFAKILPARQWILLKGNDGFFMASVKDLMRGVSNSYRVSQFDRGSTVFVDLKPDLKAGSHVGAGDTVGTIYSSAAYQYYTELQGQLKIAEANLHASRTGEKESVIRETEQKLAVSKSEAEKQFKIVERLKKLFEKKLVSEEEYQLADDELRSLNLTVEAQMAVLESVRSGVKPAEINILLADIKRIKEAIKAAEKQMDSFHILSPFKGLIEHSFSSDTLLILSETGKYFAAIPVPLEEENNFDKTGSVSIMSGDKKIRMKIAGISENVQVVNGKQCLIIFALINETDQPAIHPGAVTEATIQGKVMKLPEYLGIILTMN